MIQCARGKPFSPYRLRNANALRRLRHAESQPWPPPMIIGCVTGTRVDGLEIKWLYRAFDGNRNNWYDQEIRGRASDDRALRQAASLTGCAYENNVNPVRLVSPRRT